jgi:two-component system sensor histidine kinase HydH
VRDRPGRTPRHLAWQKREGNWQNRVGRDARRNPCFNVVMENVLENATGMDAAQLPATEKRDLLARLLKRLAHEIRNPLSSLDVHFQLLEEDLGALSPQARAQLAPRLGIIHGELHRLDSIVERFLKLAGPSALELEPVDINKIVTHVCELLRPEASARKVEILAGVEPGLPRVTVDPVRLTQALLNIVINGIQAVSGEGRVKVSAAKSGSGEFLLLRVQDTGPGIPVNELGDIFDPYFTTKAEGNGLGLWIAQQIAVAHGGDLRAENAPAGGALLTLSLPLKRKK